MWGDLSLLLGASHGAGPHGEVRVCVWGCPLEAGSPSLPRTFFPPTPLSPK